MKSKFRGYIRHSTDDFDKLWAEAIFSFDANVLLNAFRLEKASADAFLGALKPLKGRAWLAHQAGSEFFRHREDEIQKQFATYEKLKTHLSTLSSSFQNQFPRHVHIPLAEIATALDELSKSWKVRLEEVEKQHRQSTHDDSTLATYLEVFDGMVGDAPSDELLKKWHKEIEERYTKRIPPGFEDAKKKEGREYGDAVLWFQLIAQAIKEKKPIVFVTDDAKDDWWLRAGGKTLGPHPQLCQEMHDRTGTLFHAYPMHRFVEEATRRSGKEASKDIIENIKEIQREPNAPLPSQPLSITERLTPEAKLLLAAVGTTSLINYTPSNAGSSISIRVQEKDFCENLDKPAALAWEKGLQQLVRERLIKPVASNMRSYLYDITSKGERWYLLLRKRGAI